MTRRADFIDGRSAGARGEDTERREARERGSGHDGRQPRFGRQERDEKRQGGADREGPCRCERRLDRSSAQTVGDAELIAGVCGESVMRHQSLGDLFGQRRVQAALDVDRCELRVLVGVVRGELRALARQVGLLGVGLRADRYVLAGSHRHRPGDQAGDAGDQDLASRGVRGGDTHDQARGRYDAVVRAQHGGAQPADPLGTVSLAMPPGHASVLWPRPRRAWR